MCIRDRESITGIGPDDGVTLIGSHGAQMNLHPGDDGGLLDEDTAARLSMVSGELETIKSRYPAVRLEHKPSAVALHTRGVDPSVAAAATTATLEVGERYPGVHVMPGKNVVELTVLEANKGRAVFRLAAAPVEPRTTSSGRNTYSARGAGSPAI